LILVYSTLVVLAAAVAFPLVLLVSLREPPLRKNWRERLGYLPPWPAASPSPVWIQAVSVGEVQVARRLIRELQSLLPDRPFLLTTTTPAGRRVAQAALPPEVSVRFFPVDLPGAGGRALGRIRPRALVLIETEIWPNLLHACAARAVPVILANGRISDRTYPRYRLVRSLLRRSLSGIGLFCMQSQRDAERIESLGAPAERIRITGNAKWDMDEVDPPPNAVRRALGIPRDSPVLVAGSTAPGEEEIVVGVWQHLRDRHPDLRLVLAPRHPERFASVAELLEGRRVAFARRSETPSGSDAAVLLLDTLGELRSVYHAGTVCFVGGSLTTRGGQNLMEPAAAGRPVLFGHRTENFADAAASLLQAGAGFRVEDGPSLEAAVLRLLAHPDACREAGARGKEIVRFHRGAARKTAEAIAALLNAGA
jgi:3-deoxy-D-manno-octulosonic-acid transferase